MSQIMGLLADTVLKPYCKDMTVFEKGRYSGYKEAVCDVMRIVERNISTIFYPDGSAIDEICDVEGMIDEIDALLEEEA